MGQRRIATCPECGDLFPIEDGCAITTRDGIALLTCGPNCLLDVWSRENPVREPNLEPYDDNGGTQPWLS